MHIKLTFNLLTLCVSLLLCGMLSLTGCKEQPRPAAAPTASPLPGTQSLAWPSSAAYTGAYVDFGEAEDKVTLEAIENFEEKVTKHQAIIASSSFWGEQTFPTRNVNIIGRYGAVPLIFWSPWDRPYSENRAPDKFSLNSILAGKWDAYIDQWADGAKAYGNPLMVAWGIEMNGAWFPWSGYFYGGGKVIPGSQPARYEGPELFVKTYKYVVDRVRARGVKNISWGFHVNHYTYPHEDWNNFAAYYPGDNYADWLGLSVYGKQFNYQPWSEFFHVMDDAYHELSAIHPDKPLVVAEFGVGEFPRSGSKARWFTKAFDDLQNRYSRVKAAVYWHERWPNADESYSNLRVNSSPEALEAYRKGVAAPYWIDRPQFNPQ